MRSHQGSHRRLLLPSHAQVIVRLHRERMRRLDVHVPALPNRSGVVLKTVRDEAVRDRRDVDKAVRKAVRDRRDVDCKIILSDGNVSSVPPRYSRRAVEIAAIGKMFVHYLSRFCPAFFLSQTDHCDGPTKLIIVK
jgi:hypothetical protein